MKFSLVLIGALAASILFYYVSNQAVARLLENYFQVSVYIERETDRTARKLQKYISENHLASDDIDGLNKWSLEHMLVYYTVFKNGEMTYTSYFVDDAEAVDSVSLEGTVDDRQIAAAAEEDDGQIAVVTEENTYMVEEMYGNEAKQYNMEFADGTGQVYLLGLFEYQFYIIAQYIELTLSALLFLLICLVFLQRKLRDVRQLENEIKILESGGMDKEITVKGMDELSSLAIGLNQMRLSLDENMRVKEELLQANNSLVTGMAHDLRTPLTSLLLYTELLSKKKYKDESEMQQYLEKTALKANQIKNMSDRLFKQFYISQNDKVIPDPPQSLRSVLEEGLSDLVMFLESQGFAVDCSISWPAVKVSVVPEYMDRILDNIASNLQKYADASQTVEISVSLSAEQKTADTGQGQVNLKIKNKVKEECGGVESTNLGLLNMRSMMGSMNGKCIVKKEGHIYEISILLPSIMQS